VAGSLYVVACTAYAAVAAIQAQPGETVAVSAASGGVGNLVVQLLVHRQVHVLGIACSGSDDALTQLGAVPVHYGEGLEGRLSRAAPTGIDAFIDLFGPEYVHLAVDLGIPPERIETVIAFKAAEELGTRADGNVTASTTAVLTEMAGLLAAGTINLPIQATYPLDGVRQAFELLEQRHARQDRAREPT
jgi:NADPH:quinone reductase